MDLVLLAVDLDFPRPAIKISRQREVAAAPGPVAGDLPPANDLIQGSVRVAADQLAVAERKIPNPVPFHTVLGDGVVPLIVLKPVESLQICRNCVGKPQVWSREDAVAPSVAGDAERIAHGVENLVSISLGILVLELDLEAIVI